MSQHDFEITTADANTGPTVRAAINAMAQALATCSSGATEPSTTYAFQFWADTTSGYMKQRNAANNAWLTRWLLSAGQLAALSGATFTGLVNLAAGADIASATTIDLTAATGNSPRITGTTPTSVVVMNTGQQVLVVADAAWPLIYNATTNKINTGGANYICTAGDVILYHKDNSGVVHGTILNSDNLAINNIGNARFLVDQRNEGAAVNMANGSAVWGPDLWMCWASSLESGTLTAQRVAGDANSEYALRLAKTAGNYAGSLYAAQSIPSHQSKPLAGKLVNLRFRARVGSTFTGTATPAKFVFTGTGTDQTTLTGANGSWTGFATVTLTAVANPDLTTSFQDYSFIGTIGASVTEIVCGAGAGKDASAGSANDYIEIADMVLMEGQARNTNKNTYLQDLQYCEQWFEKSFLKGTAPAQNAGSLTGETQISALQAGATAQRGYVFYKTTKFAAPTTLTLYNTQAANAQVRDASAGADCSASSASSLGGVDGFNVNCTGAAGTVIANALRFHWTVEVAK